MTAKKKTGATADSGASALNARRWLDRDEDEELRRVIARKMPQEEFKNLPLRSRLIVAAIDEIEEVGFERFSVRRVASACGASCAAPYKHFKNKREFFVAILDYITDVWLERQTALLERLQGQPLRVRLVELAVEYVKFMVEYPRFRAILMIKDQTFDDGYLEVKSKISDLSKDLIVQYCAEEGIDLKIATVKMYLARAVIYGASLMFGNRELPYNEITLNYVRSVIDREFDLPWFPVAAGSEPTRAARRSLLAQFAPQEASNAKNASENKEISLQKKSASAAKKPAAKRVKAVKKRSETTS